MEIKAIKAAVPDLCRNNLDWLIQLKHMDSDTAYLTCMRNMQPQTCNTNTNTTTLQYTCRTTHNIIHKVSLSVQQQVALLHGILTGDNSTH